jgi:dynein heavy chain, axonemal
MISRETERIDFKRPVKHLSKVEEWLNMRNTLARRLKEGNSGFPQEKAAKREWILEQPAQVVVTVDMI